MAGPDPAIQSHKSQPQNNKMDGQDRPGHDDLFSGFFLQRYFNIGRNAPSHSGPGGLVWK